MAAAVVLTSDSAIDHALWQRSSAAFTARGLVLQHATLPARSTPARRRLLAAVRFLVCDTAQIDRAVIDEAPRCGAIIRVGDGYDSIDVDYATTQGIICCNQPGIWSYETAEYAFLLGLMQVRRLPQLFAAHHHPDSPRTFRQLVADYGPIQTARTIAVGVIGFGRIGQEVCKLYGRLVKQIFVADSHVTPPQLARFARRHRLSAVCRVAAFADLIAESDIITLHIPLRAENHHLISDRQFARMKSTAIVVNCARGALIDSRALYDAAAAGRIAAAALDLTEDEPLPADHYLYRSDRIYISPHFAWYSDDALQRMCQSVCDTVMTLAQRRIPPCALNDTRIDRQQMRLFTERPATV